MAKLTTGTAQLDGLDPIEGLPAGDRDPSLDLRPGCRELVGKEIEDGLGAQVFPFLPGALGGVLRGRWGLAESRHMGRSR